VTVTEEDREKFMTDERYHAFRKTIEEEGNAVHSVSIAGSEFSEGARKAFTELMKSRLAKKPELAQYLLPSFAPGCKRLTPGPGFLEALTEDNVEFIPTTIKRITEAGVELDNGRHIDLDALVCATGFNAMAAPPFSVIGKDGMTLQEKFKPYPDAYLSLAVDGFPNYMLMLGPNSGVGSGSLTKIIECLGDYIIKCKEIQEQWR
jgi:cation diffusion facilitator CzcD-associated flavoprotein CzcO